MEGDAGICCGRPTKGLTSLGNASIKQIRSPDGELDYSPEYDDCKRLAKKSGLPLREVVERLRAEARQEFGD